MSATVAFFLGLSIGVAVSVCAAIFCLKKIGEFLTIRW